MRTLFGVLALTAACSSATPPPQESKPLATATASAGDDWRAVAPSSTAAPIAAVDATPPATSAAPIASAAPTGSAASTGPAASAPEKRANGLIVEDLKVGSGPAATLGSHVVVMYVGTLVDGTLFDRSTMPFEAELGKHQLIEGWEQGIVGMRTGGKRKLTIPPALAYGARGVPPKIPPNATLVFEVELAGFR